MSLKKRIEQLEARTHVADITMQLFDGRMVKIRSSTLYSLVSKLYDEWRAASELGGDVEAVQTGLLERIPALRDIANCKSSDEDGKFIEMIQAVFLTSKTKRPL